MLLHLAYIVKNKKKKKKTFWISVLPLLRVTWHQQMIKD